MQPLEASFVPQAPTLRWAERLRGAEPPASAGAGTQSGWLDPAHCLLSLGKQAEGTQLAPSWAHRTRKANLWV